MAFLVKFIIYFLIFIFIMKCMMRFTFQNIKKRNEEENAAAILQHATRRKLSTRRTSH